MTRIFWYLLWFALGLVAGVALVTIHLGLTPQAGLGSTHFPF